MSARPTIKDVAARAGVSKGMVSLALRGVPGPSAQTAARVLQAAAELGYRADRAATSLALRRTRLLGIMMTLRNAFHAELVEELQSEAEEAGYEVVLAAVTRTRGERAAVETLLDSRCEALLLLGPELPGGELAALQHRTPVVVLGRRSRAGDVHGGRGPDVVRASDEVGMRLLVEHLVGLGHRELLHVSGGVGDIAADRRHGFEAAVAAAGVRGRVVEGAFDEEGGAAAAHRVLREGWAGTAVVAASDRVALGVLDVLVREGIAVPGRISVAGYDDSSLAQLAHVRLTSVSQDPAEQAARAVRAAVRRLEGGDEEPADVVLAPRLVVRDTTGPFMSE
ncbi:DNA-binding LacI/PurR family transcriptional regulator [Kineococcus radiotolerans]|uniref:DNA-binding LacI/PurR family transcriptional regulator n=1 Tax=Kineococcus radiotolerans TaxID=131568 RepID=A0A7W4TNX0_KINRA|nr:LacI family DNA-binding transcriptional regulator [Kineococcus radiotolerans]MBB2902390.1 DNA-binding LacI/PurR family transcriptional regulator [Kineococcus radiotolerans]